MRSPGRKT